MGSEPDAEVTVEVYVDDSWAPGEVAATHISGDSISVSCHQYCVGAAGTMWMLHNQRGPPEQYQLLLWANKMPPALPTTCTLPLAPRKLTSPAANVNDGCQDLMDLDEMLLDDVLSGDETIIDPCGEIVDDAVYAHGLRYKPTTTKQRKRWTATAQRMLESTVMAHSAHGNVVSASLL